MENSEKNGEKPRKNLHNPRKFDIIHIFETETKVETKTFSGLNYETKTRLRRDFKAYFLAVSRPRRESSSIDHT